MTQSTLTPSNAQSFSPTRSNATQAAEINTEQLSQMIEAILAGKYSWACVLMLRFSGYNPLHYIPYRTYNRLIKENIQKRHSQPSVHTVVNLENSEQRSFTTTHQTKTGTTKIKDLSHLETASQSTSQIEGGCRARGWLQPFKVLPNWQPQRRKFEYF